jgi:PhnB protein
MKLNPYLNFGGNCAEALRFYEQHLGGTITNQMTFGDSPMGAQLRTPEEKDKIIHARITIAGTEIMASDAPADRYQPMRSAYLCMGLDSAAEVDRLYALLSDGGEVFMPAQKTFFSERFAMLRDRFGVNWMLNIATPA